MNSVLLGVLIVLIIVSFVLYRIGSAAAVFEGTRQSAEMALRGINNVFG